MGKRLPVTVVAGFAGAGKSTLIAHWLREGAERRRWALLDNGSTGQPGPAAETAPGRYRTIGGCACCTSQASARSAIIELLRAGGWDRLVVELDGAAHPSALVDLLRSPPLAAHLCVDRIVAVVDAARPAPFEAEPMHPLARAQVELADRLVLNRAGRLGPSRRAALLRRLAEAPPFGRAVRATDDGRLPWPEADDRAVALPVAEGYPDAGPVTRPGLPMNWQAPAETVFDRARLQALFAALPGRLPLLAGAAAFHTPRDWYAWRFDGSAAVWEASAYRLGNRLQLAIDPASAAESGAAAADGAAGRLPLWLDVELARAVLDSQ